jgi:hypothetical protein
MHRRNYLKQIGVVGGIMSLAGCQADTGDTGNTSSEGPDTSGRAAEDPSVSVTTQITGAAVEDSISARITEVNYESYPDDPLLMTMALTNESTTTQYIRLVPKLFHGQRSPQNDFALYDPETNLDVQYDLDNGYWFTERSTLQQQPREIVEVSSGEELEFSFVLVGTGQGNTLPTELVFDQIIHVSEEQDDMMDAPATEVVLTIGNLSPQ